MFVVRLFNPYKIIKSRVCGIWDTNRKDNLHMGEVMGMKVTRKSPLTGKENSMELDITQEQLDRWKAGELIQNVFPHLEPHEREFIMTGYTQEDWEKIFGT